MKGNGSKIKRTPSNIIFNLIAYSIILVLTVFCIFPLVLIVSGSFYPEQRFDSGRLPHLAVCVFGGFLSGAVQISGRHSEGIGQHDRHHGNRNLHRAVCHEHDGVCPAAQGFFSTGIESPLSFISPQFFGGGMVPWYILLSKYLHLQNSYVARVLPLLMTPFLIILMRYFYLFLLPRGDCRICKN